MKAKIEWIGSWINALKQSVCSTWEKTVKLWARLMQDLKRGDLARRRR